jgi:hypothetical protein
MRDELPEECTKELDYRALVDTLSLVEGETVCVQINGLSSRPSGGEAPRIGFVGRLRNIGYSWAEGFAVGDSGRILLYEPDFVSASLWTYDGNDFFALTIRCGDVEFLVGDESYANDEFTM